MIHEPLFGKRLADVKVTGNRLQGACFYVVSGHGGPDPGAIGRIGKTELHEDEYAYDVALRLARNLMQEGAEVRIIIQDAKDGIRNDRYLSNSKRETCMGDPIPLNQVARLQQRCAKINEYYRKDRKKYKYCRAIFLHVDSRSKSAQTDVFFYYAPQSTLGKRLATGMKNTSNRNTTGISLTVVSKVLSARVVCMCCSMLRRQPCLSNWAIFRMLSTSVVLFLVPTVRLWPSG